MSVTHSATRPLLVLAALAAAIALLLGTPATAAAAPALAGGPLYGGMLMTSDSGGSCQTGFNVQQDGAYLVLTSGQCVAAGSQWSIDGHQLGTAVTGGDGYGLVTVDDPDYWQPQGAVLAGGQPAQVTGATQPTVGMSVCVATGDTGTSCGSITAVDVTVSFPDGVIYGLAEANLCADPDSPGAPVVSGAAAIGVVIGGTCGTSYLQPIVPVMSDHGLSLV